MPDRARGELGEDRGCRAAGARASWRISIAEPEQHQAEDDAKRHLRVLRAPGPRLTGTAAPSWRSPPPRSAPSSRTRTPSARAARRRCRSLAARVRAMAVAGWARASPTAMTRKTATMKAIVGTMKIRAASAIPPMLAAVTRASTARQSQTRAPYSAGKRGGQRLDARGHADRRVQHVVHDQRRRRDQRRDPAQVALGDRVGAAAARERLDDLAVGEDQGGQQHDDRRGHRQAVAQPRGTRRDQHDQDRLGPVGHASTARPGKARPARRARSAARPPRPRSRSLRLSRTRAGYPLRPADLDVFRACLLVTGSCSSISHRTGGVPEPRAEQTGSRGSHEQPVANC